MSDKIQEFLVGLGFKIDDAGYKRFQTALDETNAKASGLTAGLEEVVGKLTTVSAAVAAAGAGIAAAVTQIAGGLDKLYFQAKNSQTTANELKGLEYVFKSLGSSAEEADSVINGLSMFRRHFGQGADNMLLRFGVKPEHLNDTVKVFEDLERTFQRMVASDPKNGQARAFALGKALGISDNAMLVALQDNGEALKHFLELLAKSGFSYDEAADQAKKYMSELRDLGVQLDLLESELGVTFIPMLNSAATTVTRFLHAWQTGEDLGGLAGDFAELARNVEHLEQSLSGLNATAGAAADKSGLTDFLSNITRALGDVIAAMSYMIDTANDIKNWDWGKAVTDNKKAGVAIYNLIGDAVHAITGGEFKGRYAIPGEKPLPLLKGGVSTTPPTSSAPTGKGTRADRNNNPGNIKDGAFARSQRGYIGSDGTFAKFASAADGINAQLNLLRNYYSRGVDTVAEIVSKWAPPGENNTAAYINKVAKMLGVNPTAHLGVSALPDLARVMAQVEGFHGTHLAASRGGTIHASQTNNYTIHGTDPTEIAREVSKTHQDAHQRLFANIAPLAQ